MTRREIEKRLDRLESRSSGVTEITFVTKYLDRDGAVAETRTWTTTQAFSQR